MYQFLLSESGAPQLGWQTVGVADPIFPGKKLATFFWSSLYHCRFFHFTRSLAHYFRHVALYAKNLPLLLWGPFLWGPCSAEHAEHA